MPINRQDVLTAAVQVLDEVGLPDLTMRRVAAALNVAPGALYWHIPNKQSLLAAIADLILTDPALAAAASKSRMRWDRQLAGLAHALRRTLTRHRDGAEVVSASLASRLGTNDLHKWIADIALAAGASDRDARAIAVTIVHFVVGFTFEEQTHDIMRNAGAAHADADPVSRETSFSDGVSLIIDGLRHRLPS